MEASRYQAKIEFPMEHKDGLELEKGFYHINMPSAEAF